MQQLLDKIQLKVRFHKEPWCGCKHIAASGPPLVILSNNLWVLNISSQSKDCFDKLLLKTYKYLPTLLCRYLELPFTTAMKLFLPTFEYQA